MAKAEHSMMIAECPSMKANADKSVSRALV